MAWTSPRTWVAGEVVTASNMNTHLRDNMKSFGDPWTSWTPTWTAATTNPVLGNGSFSGSAYALAGKWCIARIHLAMGSTTTYGTGAWRFSYPVSINTILTGAGGAVGNAACFDTSAALRFFRNVLLAATAYISLADDASTLVASTTPFTWANGDSLAVQFEFEAA